MEDDEAHLSTLLQNVRAEVNPAEALLADAAALAGSDVVLDALLVGPSKSGKSTVVNALLGQVVCPAGSVANTLFPVAFRTRACTAEEDGRLELQVPAALRQRLEEIVRGGFVRVDPNLELPQDGVVQSSSDLEARLETLNRLGRACAEALLADPSPANEPVEVIRSVSNATPVLRRWRIVDFPGTSERSDSPVSRLIARLLDWHLLKSTTGVLICVVAKDQVGTETARNCFEPVQRTLQMQQLAQPRPQLWLLNKVDSEDDWHDLQQARDEIRLLVGDVEGCRLLHVSALQLLAHTCAEGLRQRMGPGCEDLLPAFESEIYKAFPREAEAVVRALVPAASKTSKQWRRQYNEATKCSWAKLCRSTQFPVPRGSLPPSEQDDEADPDMDNDDPGHGDNPALRPCVWAVLARAKARLVLQSLEPLVRQAFANTRSIPPVAVASGWYVPVGSAEPGGGGYHGEAREEQMPHASSIDVPQHAPSFGGSVSLAVANAVAAATAVKDLQRARDALQERILSGSPQSSAQLAHSMVEIATAHIQRAMAEVNAIADDPHAEVNAKSSLTKAEGREDQEEQADATDPQDVPKIDLPKRMHTALEETDDALRRLHWDWVVQGDTRLENLCERYALVEHVALVSEVERKSGVARSVESAIFAFFTRIGPEEARPQKDWFQSTASLYMDGIKSAAPGAANRIVDSARLKLVSAQKQVERDLVQCQWDLAEIEHWSCKLSRLQCLLASMLWMRLGLQAEPLPDADLGALENDQRELLVQRGPEIRSGESLQQLKRVRSDWLWWMPPSPCFATSLYSSVQSEELPPSSADEVLDSARQLAYSHAIANGIGRSAADEFVRMLFGSCDRLASPERAAAGLWTATHQLVGKELHALVADAFKEDARPALSSAVRLVHALQSLRISAPLATPATTTVVGSTAAAVAAWWPVTGCVYRGGCLPDECKQLFEVGRRWRSPHPLLATPSCEAALFRAHQAADPAQGRPPVLYTIRLDATRRCADAFLLGRGADGEVLFAPYAGFCVKHVQLQLQAETQPQTPHVIELEAYADLAGEADAGKWPLLTWL